MIPPLVITDQGVTVVGGGAMKPVELMTALSVAPTLVAADSGADRALSLGQSPDLVIGDLDSISSAARDILRPEQIVHVAEQESTDFSKCLSRISAPFVVAVGFTGLRLDHTLAAISTMAQFSHMNIIMLSSEDVSFIAPPSLILPLMPGTRISLYPISPSRGVSTGLQWPIEGIEFSPGTNTGTSNQANGIVTMNIDGQMLVILPRDCLATIMTALKLPKARRYQT